MYRVGDTSCGDSKKNYILINSCGTLFPTFSLVNAFTAPQKEQWENGKTQALEKCRKLGLDDSTIVNSLTRCLKANNFQISLAIQHIMDYAFSIKSIGDAEDLEGLYPISKDFVAASVSAVRT
eukprot:TRINITY_DN1187_c0_g1_i21.p1 TRINITY_DN1187_c0_g1~~TRINITY_DN1187_c0_g1_i21.p1  ORF type:complete len:123 (+),score=16.42 TRINITY_DN1187_c0_g1_i21:92-460(+)